MHKPVQLTRKKGPDTLIWLVTSRCNLACPHCYASRFLGQGELSPAEALALVAGAAQAGVHHLGLAGGEPLLRPDIIDIIHSARAQGLGVSLVTNGERVTPEVARELTGSQVGVVVSLDGSRAATHDARRGAGSFQRVLGALAALRQVGLVFRTIMALGPDNCGEVGDYLALAQEQGAAAACLIPVMPSGQARRPRLTGRDSIPSPAAVAAALATADRRSRTLEFPVHLWCLPFAGLIATSPWVSASSCRGSRSMDVTPSGDVLLCDVLDIAVSSLRGRTVGETWQEQRRHPAVRRLERAELAKVCAACPLASQCKGGCFARGQLISGDLYGPDPLCPRVASLC